MLNKKHNTAILTTVYPSVKQYLNQFIDCINKQTSKAFDLFIANDGMEGIDSYIKQVVSNVNVIDVSGTVSENRRALINNAIKSGYEFLIFIDSDDLIFEEHVEVCQKKLLMHDFCFNDLDIVDESGVTKQKKYLSMVLEDTKSIDLNYIFDGNVLGMSNVCIKSKILADNQLLLSGETKTFDWLLWSNVLLKNKNAFFVSEISTRYRNHSNNIAGFPQTINSENIKLGVDIKLHYYKSMSHVSDKYYEYFQGFNNIKQSLLDAKYLGQYQNYLRKNEKKIHKWWENIRLPVNEQLCYG